MRRYLTSALLVWGAVAHAQVSHEDHADEQPRAENYTIETAPEQVQLSLVCRFRIECVEDEACSAAGFNADLRGSAGGLTAHSMVAEMTMVTQNGATEFLGVREGSALSLAGGLFDARHLLSVTEAGIARYTIHYMQGPLMVSYLGRCEGD